MPLLNSTIMRLNEITTLVEDKTHLTSENSLNSPNKKNFDKHKDTVKIH